MNNPVLIKKDRQQIEALERLAQLKQMKIDSLLEITTAINNNYPASWLFRIFEFILRAQIGVGRAIVFHRNQGWACMCQYSVTPEIIDTIDVEKHLLKYTDTQYLSNVQDERLSEFDILIPVSHKRVPLAFLLLGDLKLSQEESLEEKIKFIQTITNIIIVAIENKRLFKQQLEQESLKKELEVAEQVQTMLIPKTLPYNDKIQMAGIYRPHHSISGDYYDYIPLSEDGNEFLVCMADVSGKGIAAALLMANFQAVLRALAKETDSLKILVEKLNARLLEITHGDKFITFFVGKHNLTTKQFTYINAGHNPPMLVHKGELQLLQKGCTILGAFDKLPFINQTTLELQPNTTIITYTDGLTDLENEEGEYFEMDRFKDFVQKNASLSITEFNNQLLQTLQAFKGDKEYTDDISILSYYAF